MTVFEKCIKLVPGLTDQGDDLLNIRACLRALGYPGAADARADVTMSAFDAFTVRFDGGARTDAGGDVMGCSRTDQRRIVGADRADASVDESGPTIRDVQRAAQRAAVLDADRAEGHDEGHVDEAEVTIADVQRARQRSVVQPSSPVPGIPPRLHADMNCAQVQHACRDRSDRS